MTTTCKQIRFQQFLIIFNDNQYVDQFVADWFKKCSCRKQVIFDNKCLIASGSFEEKLKLIPNNALN